MTTKELFENLLAGKKMKPVGWSDGHFIKLDIFGDLLECNGDNYQKVGNATAIVLTWSNWQEYKEEILTDKEKEYLSAVIKPFRDRVIGIEKESVRNNKEFIRIHLNLDTADLPYFEKDTMYKGMEVAKNYSLEELGL